MMSQNLILYIHHSSFIIYHLFSSLIGLLLTSLLLACSLAPVAANPPPERLYVIDVSHWHLNHYEHCIALTGQPGSCQSDTPPPASKSFDQLLREYDSLIFLTTLQGIVNRQRPRLYLSHDQQRLDTPGVDTFWLEKYREKNQPYGWLAKTEIIYLDDLPAVLDIFAGEVAGLVVWDPAVPATLNVATTIAGVEDLAVLRAGSEITPEVTRYLAV